MSYLKRISLFGLLLALTVVPAIAQDYRGNIYLNVTTEDGTPVEGASVMAIGASGSRTAETGADGFVRFSRLEPGFYTVEVSKDGFNTAVYERVELNTGTNVEMDIALARTEVVERVVVTSRTPVLDKRKTGTSTVISPREIEQIPTARDPWAVLSTIPGIQADRVNVGGNQSGQQAGFAGKGDNGDNATWVMDGVEFTDLAAQGGSSTYFDFNSFQEVGFQTGGGALEQTTPGQQLSFVTKQGSNRHTGSIALLLADEDFQDDQTPYTQPDGATFRGDRIAEAFEKVFEIGGPIVADKAWYWGGFSQNDIDIAKPAGPGLEQADRTKLRNTTGKVNGTVGGKTNWKGFYTRGDKIKIGRNASNERPPETTWNQSGPTPIYTADVGHFFTPDIEVQFQASHVGGGFGLAPQGVEAQMQRDASEVWHGTYVDYLTDRPTDQYAVRGNWFTETGSASHEFKFGFKYKNGEVQSFSTYGTDNIVADELYVAAWVIREGSAATEADYTTAWVGDTVIFGNWTFNAGLTYQQQEGEQTASLSPMNALAPSILGDLSYSGLDPGFDWSDTMYRAGTTYTFDTPHRQLIRFSTGSYVDQLGSGDVGSNNPMGPAGIVYGWVDDGDRLVQWDDTTCVPGAPVAGSCEIDTSDFIFSFNVDTTAPNVPTPADYISTSLEAPEVTEYILGYEIEVAPDFTLGVNLTQRERDNTTWSPLINLNSLPGGFTQGDSTAGVTWIDSSDFVNLVTTPGMIECVDGGSPAVGGPCGLPGNGTAYMVDQWVLDDAAVTAGRQDPSLLSFYSNRPGYSEDYQSLEFTATKRLSNRWMLRAFLSLQDWEKDIACTSTDADGSCIAGPGIQNPSNRVGDTNVDGSDVVVGAGTSSGAFGDVFVGTSGWQFNVNGLYQLPKNFTVSANLQGREGYVLPIWERVATAGTAVGTQRTSMQVGSVDSYRLDDIFVLDLGVKYLLQLSGDTTVDLGFDIFNAMGDDTILQLERRMDTAAGRIDEVLSPQVFRLSAKVTF